LDNIKECQYDFELRDTARPIMLQSGRNKLAVSRKKLRRDFQKRKHPWFLSWHEHKDSEKRLHIRVQCRAAPGLPY